MPVGFELEPREDDEPPGKLEPDEPEEPPEGIVEELPPPAEPDPDDDGPLGGVGMLVEEDCWSGHPPIRKSAVTPTPSRRPNAPVTTLRIWMFIVPPCSTEWPAESRWRCDCAMPRLNVR